MKWIPFLVIIIYACLFLETLLFLDPLNIPFLSTPVSFLCHLYRERRKFRLRSTTSILCLSFANKLLTFYNSTTPSSNPTEYLPFLFVSCSISSSFFSSLCFRLLLWTESRRNEMTNRTFHCLISFHFYTRLASLSYKTFLFLLRTSSSRHLARHIYELNTQELKTKNASSMMDIKLIFKFVQITNFQDSYIWKSKDWILIFQKYNNFTWIKNFDLKTEKYVIFL